VDWNNWRSKNDEKVILIFVVASIFKLDDDRFILPLFTIHQKGVEDTSYFALTSSTLCCPDRFSLDKKRKGWGFVSQPLISEQFTAVRIPSVID
jgi:hypothetical protein